MTTNDEIIREGNRYAREHRLLDMNKGKERLEQTRRMLNKARADQSLLDAEAHRKEKEQMKEELDKWVVYYGELSMDADEDYEAFWQKYLKCDEL